MIDPGRDLKQFLLELQARLCKLMLQDLIAHQFVSCLNTFLDERVAYGECLYFSVIKNSIVDVRAASFGKRSGQEARNESLLSLEQLPGISVKASFCDIAVDIDFAVCIALP